jgi:23S rRNA maturation-related 3'-5' exoribonuclease YhaM
MPWNIDSEPHNADWTKQSWDLNASNAQELDDWLESSGRSPAEFMKHPVFTMNVDKMPWLNQWATKHSSLSYNELLDCISDRVEEIQQFEKFLRNETSWLTSPASTRFHLAEKGGLVKHSLNVANTLLKLRSTLAPDISEECCVIAGLYHDIGKIGMPGKPYYLPNPSEWHVKNRGVYYIINQDIVHMDIATRSLFLVSQHITLTDEEAQAIRYHDGQYIDENKSVAHREIKLTRLLQYADNWSGGDLEDRSNQL